MPAAVEARSTFAGEAARYGASNSIQDSRAEFFFIACSLAPIGVHYFVVEWPVGRAVGVIVIAM